MTMSVFEAYRHSGWNPTSGRFQNVPGDRVPAQRRTCFVVGLMLCLGMAVSAQVTDPSPKLEYLLPAGGQRGQSLEVLVCGQNLNRITDVVFDNPQISGEFIHFFEDMRPDQEKGRQTRAALMKALPLIRRGEAVPNDLIEQMSDQPQLVAIKEGSPTMLDVRRVQYEYLFERVRSAPNRSLSSFSLLKVNIPETVKPGLYDMRVKTAGGVSRPLPFHVSDLPEILEAEPCTEDNRPVDPPFDLPLCINGQIVEGDIDIYPFRAEAGRELELKVMARELKPFIADAVPGWFEAVLTVYGPDGKELGCSDCTQFRPDPSLRMTLPETGVYTVSVRDSIWRGRIDFVYRLLIQDAAEPDLPEFEHVLAEPGAVNEHPFSARAGQKLFIRTLALAKGSPIDTWVQVVDANGTVLAENDDAVPSVNTGLQTVFADSELVVKIPTSGNYIVRVSDTAQKGGPEFGYDLKIDTSRPTAELYVSPAAIQCFPGQSVPITFHAVRHEGFDKEIKVDLIGSAAGFELDSAVIPAGQDQVTAVLTVPGSESESVVVFEGNGSIPVVPADDWEQAFLWHHLVPTDLFQVSVVQTPLRRAASSQGSGSSRFAQGPLMEFERVRSGPVEFRPNRQVCVRFTSSRVLDEQTFSFRILEGPPGVRIDESRIKGREIELMLASDRRIEQSGNLIIEVIMKRTFNREAAREVQLSIGTLPAVTYK
jgi:hypothetical protein